MDTFSGPVFEMARDQFQAIADYMEIPESARARLLYPKRAITIACPVNLDNGATAVFQGFRVQHHLTLGPTKGGTRFAPTVDMGEVAALAIWMSWKCALAGLPYGGAKGGVTVDVAKLSRRELEALSRRYMQEMIPFVGPHVDVMAPDMGTNEQVMAWFMDTYSMYQGKTVSEIVTGKPVTAGGTEGRREATGLGVVHLVNRAMERRDMRMSGSTCIIQGFGNVGSVAAEDLDRRGAKLIGVSDHSACYFDKRGLDVRRLLDYAQENGKLEGFSTEATFDPSELLVQRCDVLIPAASERVINWGNASKLNCRILAEGANGPTTPEADEILDGRRTDVFIIPDILCNAGGVIVSYFEWVQGLQRLFWDREAVLSRLFGKLDDCFERVTSRAERDQVSMRKAAMALGIQKVLESKQSRGLFP